jgi:hypothetical protein
MNVTEFSVREFFIGWDLFAASLERCLRLTFTLMFQKQARNRVSLDICVFSLHRYKSMNEGAINQNVDFVLYTLSEPGNEIPASERHVTLSRHFELGCHPLASTS